MAHEPGPYRSDRRRHEDTVIAVLAGHSAFRSVAQLHDELRARGHGMGLATVYRRLGDLARRGDVDVIPGHRGEARYRLRGVHTEHRPLVCTLCQRVVDVDSAEVTSWARATAARHGFTDVRVRAVVTGTCPVCPVAPSRGCGLDAVEHGAG